VSVFIYLDATTIDNGCTYIVPGSHLLPHVGPQSGDGAGVWADEYPEYALAQTQAVPVPMQAGGVLVIDSLTFHSVGVNSTPGSRRSMVFACHSADSLTEHPDVSSTVLLVGHRRFRGNSALRVSGSLIDPSM
jgi:ectoine hydroxylase-related dioxygenase (phytanoyl-CoA dioxygenase family)